MSAPKIMIIFLIFALFAFGVYYLFVLEEDDDEPANTTPPNTTKILTTDFLKSMNTHYYATPIQNESTHGVQYNNIISNTQDVVELQNMRIGTDWGRNSTYAPVTYFDKLYIHNIGSTFRETNLTQIFATTTTQTFDGYNPSARNGSMFFVIGKILPNDSSDNSFFMKTVDTTFKAGALLSHAGAYYGTQRGNSLDIMYDETNHKLKYGMTSYFDYTSYFFMSDLIDYDNTKPFIVYVEVENNNTMRIYHNNELVVDYTYTAKPHLFWAFDGTQNIDGGSTSIQAFGNSGLQTYGAQLGGLNAYVGDIIGFTRVLTDVERTSVYERIKF